jgi:DNA-binding MarR family transcriptional regulator
MPQKLKPNSRSMSVLAAQAERMERNLSAIRQALRRPLDAEVAKGKLTAPQTAVIQVVVSRPGISLKELSREVSLAHSTVSGIADRLEKQGMLERKTDREDGRISRIFPTAVVTAFVRDRIPALAQGPLQSALKRARPAERTAIVQALQRLRELLSAD